MIMLLWWWRIAGDVHDHGAAISISTGFFSFYFVSHYNRTKLITRSELRTLEHDHDEWMTVDATFVSSLKGGWLGAVAYDTTAVEDGATTESLSNTIPLEDLADVWYHTAWIWRRQWQLDFRWLRRIYQCHRPSYTSATIMGMWIAKHKHQRLGQCL